MLQIMYVIHNYIIHSKMSLAINLLLCKKITIKDKMDKPIIITFKLEHFSIRINNYKAATPEETITKVQNFTITITNRAWNNSVNMQGPYK